MALILLVGASLFVRSFLNLQSASPGFDTAPLLTARFFMTGESYATDEQKAQRVDDIMRRIEALPGVDAAVRVELRSARCRRRQRTCDRRRPHVPAGEEPTILFTAVTPHLYKTMGLPIVKGRDFTDAKAPARRRSR